MKHGGMARAALEDAEIARELVTPNAGEGVRWEVRCLEAIDSHHLASQVRRGRAR